ncbi:hypothetical protein [Flexivirga alba]|uniref:PH domain-containing protein n=1 Tax=Flexivirga alba TaxID=702742 RepID=A0ABW2AK12_9MICO
MSEKQPLLVEVNAGEFAVFGGIDLDGVTIERAPLLPRDTRKSFEDTVSAALAAGNVGARAAAALGSFEGLVRLSPATVEAISAGATPMSNGMFNLGSLTNGNGQIVQTIQWTPAGATTLSAAAATIAPALALLGIQLQLVNIIRLVEEGKRLTDALLVELRSDSWATVRAQHEGMLAMVAEAQAIGAVNDNIWQNVQGNEFVLRDAREGFRRKVDEHLLKLDRASTPTERREVLDHHGDAIVADVQGLLQAQAAWFTYQAIRAGNIRFNSDRDSTAQEHLITVVANARLQHAQDLRDATGLIDALVRRSSAMVEAEDSASIPFGRKRRAAKQVAYAGKALAQQLATLHDAWGLIDPPLPSPKITARQDGDDVERSLRIIRWHLHPAEQLLAITVAQDQSSSRDAWAWKLQNDWLVLAVTNERVVVAKQKMFYARGEIVDDIPLSDLRYVRYEPGSGKPNRSEARMDITTAKGDLKLKFADWAAEGRSRKELDSLALLLQSQMTLPATEVPGIPDAITASE